MELDNKLKGEALLAMHHVDSKQEIHDLISEANRTIFVSGHRQDTPPIISKALTQTDSQPGEDKSEEVKVDNVDPKSDILFIMNVATRDFNIVMDKEIAEVRKSESIPDDTQLNTEILVEAEAETRTEIGHEQNISEPVDSKIESKVECKVEDKTEEVVKVDENTSKDSGIQARYESDESASKEEGKRREEDKQKETQVALATVSKTLRRKRKVRKEAKQLAKQMGITRENVQRAREKKILKEEDMVKQQDKSVPTPPKQAKAKLRKFAPTSNVQKVVPPPKSQSTTTNGAEKRKEKPMRKPRTQGEPFGKARPSKKQKSEIDKALKSSKLEGPYTIVPLLQKIIDTIVKEGNLTNLSIYYENSNEKYWRAIEEAVVHYMNSFSKALIERSSMIPKELYDSLDAQRHIASLEDERLKEYTLVKFCLDVTKDEIQRILVLAKENFQSRHRVNKIIFGRIDKVVKDTKGILKKILKENDYQVNPKKDDSQPKGQSRKDTSPLLVKDSLIIEVYSEEAAKEIADEKRADEKATKEVDVAKSDTNASVVAEKDKGEEKDKNASVIMARATIHDKEK
ncbi:uncharacterized protein LOC131865151 [Cryptomeria japonica]|uniref:uncharacterized protein LOC131865151 n=1 Tax=Cryptomeria japonica TaxID=3369 RepID=UPI0027D9EDB4|nr:uncharacterized protein LOC131865151 [Cryptomeria japonica]